MNGSVRTGRCRGAQPRAMRSEQGRARRARNAENRFQSRRHALLSAGAHVTQED